MTDASDPGRDTTTLSMVERHVREGEARIADQERRAAELERDGHHAAAVKARALLATMRETLRLAFEHMELERRRIAASHTPG